MVEEAFLMLSATIDSNRKIKKNVKELERNQVDIVRRLDHMQRHGVGETSAPYVPVEWPPLEVSDDFGEEVSRRRSLTERILRAQGWSCYFRVLVVVYF